MEVLDIYNKNRQSGDIICLNIKNVSATNFVLSADINGTVYNASSSATINASNF